MYTGGSEEEDKKVGDGFGEGTEEDGE